MMEFRDLKKQYDVLQYKIDRTSRNHTPFAKLMPTDNRCIRSDRRPRTDNGFLIIISPLRIFGTWSQGTKDHM